jgi:phage terminase Nu1 subunit (DNA packaging protein)
MIYIETRYIVSLNELARIGGISGTAIEFWIRKGMPYVNLGNVMYAIDLRKAYDWLVEHGYKGEYLKKIAAEIERREHSDG